MNAGRPVLVTILLAALASSLVPDTAASTPDLGRPGDRAIAAYFQSETARLQRQCLANIRSQADAESTRQTAREQLLEMLGLWPLPERTDLQPVVTGQVQREGFRVERLHFQSRPGLYVTANLYLPDGPSGPFPAVLYVCGHGASKSNNVSYGNKVSYQHHGIWFAQHGYVCLMIDTLQLGEIEGKHHGTYRFSQWWWNSRGYTPAGVEAWNSIRAIDYLETRREVDRRRIGMTGRSGGGAYTWTVAALDDRVKVAAPVAGITDLQNHVVDGTVRGHCDCMFHVNTYGWDFPQLAALLAPRPLLFANSDKDTIFPLDGVLRVHAQARRIYGLYGASTNLGLLITEGPHKDTQDLQVPVFRWFNRHLKGEDPPIERAALKLFAPAELRVFATLPADERNSHAEEWFVPAAEAPPVPASIAEWHPLRKHWMTDLRRKVFGGWPDAPPPAELTSLRTASHDGVLLEVAEFNSQPSLSLPGYLLKRSRLRRPATVHLHVLDETQWSSWAEVFHRDFGEPLLQTNSPPVDIAASEAVLAWVKQSDHCLVLVTPRGIGRSAWTAQEPERTHIRRRFQLLGQTLEAMRVWDIVRGAAALRSRPLLARAPMQIHAAGEMAVNALYASLFLNDLRVISLADLPPNQRSGPDYLNVSRILDLPQTLALAADRTRVLLACPAPDLSLTFPQGVLRLTGREQMLSIMDARSSELRTRLPSP